MQARLAAKDIACRRGDRLLFAGLSLDLAPRDAVLVSGANGIGKSSLLRILAGLLRPYAGKVTSEGAIGLVDERLALDEHAPLGEALKFWERLDGCSGPEQAFEIMQLNDLLDVPVRYLSTGQRKRAALARLLNGGAKIWLLDEPLNGLDAEAQERAEELIAAHCNGGGICVAASHQGMALPDAKRVELAEYAA